MVAQLTLNWAGPGHSPKHTVINYFNEIDLPAKVTALRAFLEDYAPWMDTSYAVSIDPEVRVLNTVTGALEGIETIESPGAAIVGTVTGEQVPDVAQILVQWRTASVVSGRFLRGRSFLPGFAADFTAAGNPQVSATNQIATAAQALCDSGHGPQVWSRTHGTVLSAVSATVWGEFAVLRRRRG